MARCLMVQCTQVMSLFIGAHCSIQHGLGGLAQAMGQERECSNFPAE